MNMATVEIQKIKFIMQTMVQAMQSMMMSNGSSGLVAKGSVVRERPKKWSQSGYLTELVDSEGSSHSPTHHMPKRLHERRLAKLMSSSGSILESDLESGSDSETGSTACPKGFRSDRQYE